jgi:tetratricopeptide (TPR) repeat protein
MEKLFQNTKYFVLGALVFLFPFFFLPFSQEYFITQKFYLLAFGSLLLILISTLQLIFSKRLVWQKGYFDNLLVLFLLSLAISIIISSPNKVQALLNPHFGLVTFLSLTILYFYLTRQSPSGHSQTNSRLIQTVSKLSALLLSLITLVFFFQPFKNVNLPQSLQFLKNPSFTPIGGQLDLAIFLGFFVVWSLAQTLTATNTADKNGEKNNKYLILNTSYLILNLLAFFLTLYSLLKPVSINSNQLQPVLTNLPPFRLSWYAAVEILKNPLTALFGVGVDNFAAIFTRVKDLAYNQSINWQISAFTLSRSGLLHLFTETGIFGLVTFLLLIISLIKKVVKDQKTEISPLFLSIGYLLLVILFFPPSLIVWFLLFLVIAQTEEKNPSSIMPQSFDLANLLPFYLGLALLAVVFVAVGGYFLGRSYLAEFYFKKSLDGYLANNGQQVYENQRQAIILNPYLEGFRLSFSQTNLLIANNLASKVQQTAATKEQPGKTAQLSEQDRQTITQAIQAAINEAKAAVALNPQKAGNWENLANIYRNVINVAQGADVWTISAYQRAIVADPQNPGYRLNLGGVYYSLANFDEAGKLFEQAVALKPDWANAFYNLAWASYQKKDYQKAVNAMENALRLIDPVKNKTDYDKAKSELEEFKSKLPKEQTETSTTNQKPSQLALPTPLPTGQPKIELPKEASPEAK